MAWAKVKREELKGTEIPTDEDGKKYTQAKYLGILWNKMSAEDKQPFNDTYKQEKAKVNATPHTTHHTPYTVL